MGTACMALPLALSAPSRFSAQDKSVGKRELRVECATLGERMRKQSKCAASASVLPPASRSARPLPPPLIERLAGDATYLMFATRGCRDVRTDAPPGGLTLLPMLPNTCSPALSLVACAPHLLCLRHYPLAHAHAGTRAHLEPGVYKTLEIWGQGQGPRHARAQHQHGLAALG